MSDVMDLEVQIRKDSVRLTVDGRDYEGKPQFTPRLFKRLEELRPQQQSEEYGKQLFEAVFRATRSVSDGYAIAQNMALKHEVQWRLRLDIDPGSPELHALWWECLYDPDPPPRWLGASGVTPMSRYLAGAVSDPLPTTSLRVLAVIANPTDLGGPEWPGLERIDEAREVRTFSQALKGLGNKVSYDILTSPASRPAIRHKLEAGAHHVLHLVCHGSFRGGKGVVVLEREDNETAVAVDDQALGEMVGDLRDLKLVVLSACDSATQSDADAFLGLAPQVLVHGVPAVVAMQGQVEMEVARAFTRTFYGALAAPRYAGMVDAAINAARQTMRMELADAAGIWDWAKPVLFLRGNGQLFKLQPSRVPREARSPLSPSPPGQEPGPRAPRLQSPSVDGRVREADPTLRERLRLQSLARKSELTDDEITVLADEQRIELPSENEASTARRFRELIEAMEGKGQLDRLRPLMMTIFGLREEPEGWSE
jgi:hypothetical protein